MASVYVNLDRIRQRRPSIQVQWDDGRVSHHWEVHFAQGKMEHRVDGFDDGKTVAVIVPDEALFVVDCDDSPVSRLGI